MDGGRNPLWDYITDFKVIYIPEYKEKYEIHIAEAEDNEITKSITGTALAEVELSQLLLDQIEINTENDMARASMIPGMGYDENFPTVFYRNPDQIQDYGEVWNGSEKYQNYSPEDKKEVLRTSSLLHRLLEKAPNYRIGHVDDTLQALRLVLSFSISNVYLYNELVGEIAEEYGVLFTFDSIQKTVSAHDLYNTCSDCGYRGDFENVCPKCGSVSFHGQYGEDTTIFVSSKNLAESITKDGDPDSVKTAFRIEGGDDVITAAVANINPDGANTIYSLPEEILRDMPGELVEKIKAYHALYDDFSHTRPFTLDLDDYNDIVSYLDKHYPDTKYPVYHNPLTGYGQTTDLLYNLIDMESVLKTSMMPTASYDWPSIDETMTIISGLSDIAVLSPATSMTAYVNNAVLDMARASVNTALYKTEIYESNGYPTYTADTTGIWKGYIKLTSLEVEDKEIAESRISGLLTFSVTDNVELYIKQKIRKNMAKIEIRDILDLTNTGDDAMSPEAFAERLQYYSADCLESLKTEFEACLSVIYEMKDTADEQTYAHFLALYNGRLRAIDTEKGNRQRQLEKLYRLYYLNQTDFTESGELIEIRDSVKKSLDFEKYLGEYWPVFCSYLREDTYQNSNYISTGLNDQEVLARAKELCEAAKRELEKASHNQYTIRTTLDNLLQIPEFYPLTEHFQVGNWIHVAFDDEVYRLRLLSFQINFDELQTIDVEFSTAVGYRGAFSDVKDVIDSARTISGSYHAVTGQMQKTADAAAHVYAWVKDGLDATMTKYVNDPFTQDIVIDKNGILCRAYDEIKGQYDPNQIRILRNGMYLTNNGWEDIYAGIGKISYDDPVNGDHVDDYGIIAKTVVGRLVLGEFLGFANADGSMHFDEGGLTVESSHTAACINPNAENVFSIKRKSASGKYDTDVMYVDKNGNGYFEGEVYSTSGMMGGWEIGDGYMRTKDSANRYTGIGTTGKAYAFYAGGTAMNGSDGVFRVDHGGELLATNAVISGKITGKTIDIKASSQKEQWGEFAASFTADAEHGLALTYDQGNYSGSLTMSTGKTTVSDNNYVIIISPQSVKISGFDVGIEAGNGLRITGEIVSTDNITSAGIIYGGQVNVGTKNAAAYLNLGNNGALVYTQNGDGNVYFRYKTSASAGYSYTSVKGIIDTLDGKAASGHTHNYLPLSGGAMTGSIKFNSSGIGIYNNVTGNYMLRYNDNYTCLGNGAANTGVWSKDDNLHLRTTNTIFTKSGSSDIRVKKDILEISDAYEDFFMSVTPYSFRYAIDHDTKIHIGYMAQDVIANAEKYGIPADNNLWGSTEPEGDALAYVEKSDRLLRINYLEWVPLNTFMIQQVYKRMLRQEKELINLKERLQLYREERSAI